jgi:hypothetical protein
MNLRSIIRKLDIAEAIIRPANSMGARLKRLTPEQRAIYDEYQRVYDRWWARATRFRDPGDVAGLIINGEIVGPELPLDVQRVLFDEQPALPANATEQEIADAYHRMVENNNPLRIGR